MYESAEDPHNFLTLICVLGDHRHTLQTHRTNEHGPEPEAPHLVPPIQAAHIYSRPEARLVTKLQTHKYSDRFTPPHLLFRTSSPTPLTNKFNKTLILTNYQLLLPATFKNVFLLALSFFSTHTSAPSQHTDSSVL